MRALYSFCQRIVNAIMPFASKVMDVFGSTPNELYAEAGNIGRLGFTLHMTILRGLGLADLPILELMLVTGVGLWIIISILTFFTNLVS